MPMATLGGILDDMGSIIASIEAIGPRLHNPRLRPSDQEVTRLHELATSMLEHAQYLRDKSISCASAWAPEIFQKSDEHMSRAQSAIQTAAEGKVKWSILRRNLAAIYQGHSASVVDSPSLKARKARKAQKGLTLRSLGAGAILAWGVSLPPSLWEEMDQLVFNDVTKQMTEAAVGSEPIAEIASNARDIIRDLGKEEPFCGIESYQHFVHGEPETRIHATMNKIAKLHRGRGPRTQAAHPAFLQEAQARRRSRSSGPRFLGAPGTAQRRKPLTRGPNHLGRTRHSLRKHMP